MQTRIRTLMIIPARSGSKGVVVKNIRLLNNKPLLAWTTSVAKAIRNDDCLLIISTDSAHYADLAETLGVMAPFLRPESLSNDKAAMADVMLHAVDWFEKAFNYQPEQLMCLQSTSPFRRVEHIDTALQWMNDSSAVIGTMQIDRDLTTLFSQQNVKWTPLSRQIIREFKIEPS